MFAAFCQYLIKVMMMMITFKDHPILMLVTNLTDYDFVFVFCLC